MGCPLGKTSTLWARIPGLEKPHFTGRFGVNLQSQQESLGDSNCWLMGNRSSTGLKVHFDRDHPLNPIAEDSWEFVC